jgi:hypothetical protein
MFELASCFFAASSLASRRTEDEVSLARTYRHATDRGCGGNKIHLSNLEACLQIWLPSMLQGARRLLP